MRDAAELWRGLLLKARSDRIAMQASLAAEALDAACFHAQQMSEKCLKAFLIQRGVSLPYIHNLTKMAEICAGTDAKFRSLLPMVALLTPDAVELRYDDSFWPSHQVAEDAQSSVLTVLWIIVKRKPADIRKSAE